MPLQIFLDVVHCVYGQTFLIKYMPRSGKAELYTMCGFNFITNSQTALYRPVYNTISMFENFPSAFSPTFNINGLIFLPI